MLHAVEVRTLAQLSVGVDSIFYHSVHSHASLRRGGPDQPRLASLDDVSMKCAGEVA